MTKLVQFDMFSKGFVRRGDDDLQRQVSDATGISFEGQKSMTQQEFRDECDVNNIMERYEAAGVDARDLIADVVNNGRFGDCTMFDEYHASMNFVAEAAEAFDRLPAKIRARFHNDAGEMLRFLDDKENNDEAIRLGLISAPKAPDDEGGVTPPVAPNGASKTGSRPVNIADNPSET